MLPGLQNNTVMIYTQCIKLGVRAGLGLRKTLVDRLSDNARSNIVGKHIRAE
jgi:hypothetical protein